MKIDEAIKRLKHNLARWKKIDTRYYNTDIIDEIVDDYTAIEIVLKELERCKADLYETNNIISDYIDITAKQDKIIELMVKHICDIIDNDDNASLLPFYDSDNNIEEKVKQYFENKAEEGK